MPPPRKKNNSLKEMFAVTTKIPHFWVLVRRNVYCCAYQHRPWCSGAINPGGPPPVLRTFTPVNLSTSVPYQLPWPKGLTQAGKSSCSPIGAVRVLWLLGLVEHLSPASACHPESTSRLCLHMNVIWLFTRSGTFLVFFALMTVAPGIQIFGCLLKERRSGTVSFHWPKRKGQLGQFF